MDQETKFLKLWKIIGLWMDTVEHFQGVGESVVMLVNAAVLLLERREELL